MRPPTIPDLKRMCFINNVKMYQAFFTVTLCLTCFQCTVPQKDAEWIINKAIETHGGDNYQNLDLEFDFRDIHYTVYTNNGQFEYTRTFQDSSSLIKDVYNNSGFNRFRDGKIIEVIKEQAVKYQSSVNSVVYFFLLPYKLDDPAVNAELIGETVIDGNPYYEVKITFNREGGGKDFDDIFTYWIHRGNYSMDYLGYLFHVDGGGTRFRKAFNQRKSGGILISDYINYKGPQNLTDIPALDSLYKNGQLEKLSLIEIENLVVNTID